MAKHGINKVILVGRVGQEPEVKYSNSGTAFATISLATSETWKDKQTGEQKEQTEWHRVSFVGKLAEIVGQYVKKGAKLYVEGQLRTRKWQDSTGADRYTTEVHVGIGGEMQMLDSRSEGAAQQPANNQQQQRQPQQQQQPQNRAQQAQQGQWYTQDEMVNQQPSGGFDDIPF